MAAAPHARCLGHRPDAPAARAMRAKRGCDTSSSGRSGLSAAFDATAPGLGERRLAGERHAVPTREREAAPGGERVAPAPTTTPRSPGRPPNQPSAPEVLARQQLAVALVVRAEGEE